MVFTKRVYSTRSKIYLYGTGTILALISFLAGLGYYGVNITSSGDIQCAGTIEEPCVSFINITTNRYAIVFPKSVLYFSDNPPLDYKLYKKDTLGRWRTFNISGKTMNNESLWELKLIGFKEMNETVKWGIKTGATDLDPVWKGYSKNDFFTRLIENKADITGGYGLFEFCNPVSFNIPLDETKAGFYFNKVKGDFKTFKSSIGTNYNETIENRVWISNVSVTEKTGGNGTKYNDYIDNGHFNYFNTIVEKTGFVPIDSITRIVKPKECKQIRLDATWKAGEDISIDWQPDFNISGIKFKQGNWSWFNVSWNATYPINVNASTNLTDYQLPIVFPRGSCNANYSDFRVTKTDNATALPYWIKNYTSTNASIWFKGNFTTLNGTQAYAWCGNPAATSTSNISATFIFGDDFSEDLSRWNMTPNALNWVITNGYLNHTSTAVDYARIKNTSALPSSYILEARVQTPATGAQRLGIFGYKQYDNNVDDGNVILGSIGDVGLYNIYALGWITSGSNANIQTNTWYNLKLLINTSTEKLYVDDVLNLSTTTSGWTAGNAAGIVGSTKNYQKFDDFRIIKYMPIEPTVSIGAEQTNGDTTSPVVTIDTPANGATYYSVPYINGTAIDDNLYAIKTNSTYYNTIDFSNPFNFTNTSAIPDGTYTINVSANDTSGNVGWANRTFTLDMTPPYITLYLNGTNTDIFKELGDSVNITACTNVTGKMVYINTTHPSLTNPIANGTPCATYLWNQSTVVINQFNNSATTQNHSANNISGVIINSVSDLQLGQMYLKGYSTKNMCYQETANISTICGGLETGTYNLTPDALHDDHFYDGDWITYGNFPTGQNYINYSKPDGLISAIWQLKDDGAIRNMTVPTDCFNLNTIQFRINVTVDTYLSVWSLAWYDCYNGTTWKTLSTFGNPVIALYEEAMFWNLTTYPNNISIDIGNDGILDYWMLYMKLQDVYGITNVFKTNVATKNLIFTKGGTNVAYIQLPCNSQANSLSWNVSGGNGTQTLTKVDNLNQESLVFSTENSSNIFKLYFPGSSTVSSSPTNITIKGTPYYNDAGTLSGGIAGYSYLWGATYITTTSKYYGRGTVTLTGSVLKCEFGCDLPAGTLTNTLVGDSGVKGSCSATVSGGWGPGYGPWSCVATISDLYPAENLWVTSTYSGGGTEPCRYESEYSCGPSGYKYTSFSNLKQYDVNNATNMTIWYNGTTLEYQYLNELNSSNPKTINLSATNMNNYLSSCTQSTCPIPYTMKTNKRGNITISQTNVDYINSISNITFDIGNDGTTDASISGSSIPNNNVTIGAIGLNAITIYAQSNCVNNSVSIPIVATSATAGTMSLSNLLGNVSINPISLNISAFTNYMNGNTTYFYNTTTMCYQETANISTDCGGLNSGKYSISGSWSVNPEYFYDGSWETWAYSNSGGIIYVNYSKPPYALNTSLWVGKSSISPTFYDNMTIISSCWNYNSTKIILRYSANAGEYFQCFNGTWNTIGGNGGGYGWVNEEAMWWNISNLTSMIGKFTGNIQVPIKYTADNWEYTADNWGILNTYSLAINALTDYNYTFTGWSQNAVSNMTKTVKLIWSNFSVKLPETWLDYVEFVPSTNSSKNVTPVGQSDNNLTPVGQSDNNPIFNFSYLAKEQPMNITVALNETLDSCLNLTISPNSNKTSGRLLNTTVLYNLINNFNSSSGTKGLWLWGDSENCNASASRWLYPVYLFTAKCSNCV